MEKEVNLIIDFKKNVKIQTIVVFELRNTRKDESHTSPTRAENSNMRIVNATNLSDILIEQKMQVDTKIEWKSSR